MSDKDRQKKAGGNKDKKNQRMREAVSARKQTNPTPRQKEKHEAKLTDTVPEGAARMRKKDRTLAVRLAAGLVRPSAGNTRHKCLV
jgi:hypothetical protein